MSKLVWIVGIATVAAAAYVLLTNVSPVPATGSPDVAEAGNAVGNWGTKQRVTGTGGELVGKLKQGVGETIGDDQMANSGALDQVEGAVKDTVGQVAHAVSQTVHDLNR